MKKTLNINLGGIAFIIDENAFELLFQYLEALKKKFHNEAERREILNDIEARMAEMFTEKLGNRKEVLGVEEVEAVIALMGRPEDIAGEEPFAEENTTTAGAHTHTASNPQPVKKRLYRDPDDAKVAGVIAGLCHYFGIEDPVWMRIAAIVLIFFSSGSIIALYVLLIIVIPKATTAAEKLQMKGEPINISTIEKEVKETAQRITVTAKASIDSDDFFQKLWGVVVTILKGLGRLLALVMVFGALAALVGVFIAFVAFLIFGSTPFNGVSHLLVDQSGIITMAAIGLLLFLGAPLVALIYVGLRALVGGGQGMPWVKWALLAGWVIGGGLLLYSVIDTGMNFTSGAAKRERVHLMQPAAGHLVFQLADSTAAGWTTEKQGNDEEDEDETGFGVVINGKNINDLASIKLSRPHIELMPSENDSFYLQKIITARGKNRVDALKNAEMAMYSFMQTDTVVNLKRHIEIPTKGGKWRGQEMKLRIAIPEGKTVYFGSNIDECTAVVKGDSYYDRTYFANTTWTVEKGKVKCLDCEEEAEDGAKVEAEDSTDTTESSHEDF